MFIIFYSTCIIVFILKINKALNERRKKMRKIGKRTKMPSIQSDYSSLFTFFIINIGAEFEGAWRNMNQRTNGPVNAHLIPEPSISTKHTKPG